MKVSTIIRLISLKIDALMNFHIKSLLNLDTDVVLNENSVLIKRKFPSRSFWLSIVSLIFLFLSFWNLSIGSSLIGGMAFVGFLLPLIILVSNVFFSTQSIYFKLSFGFASLLAILSVFGALTYLIASYAWLQMLIFLALIPIILFLINNKSNKINLHKVPISIKYPFSRKWFSIDLLFVFLIIISLIFLWLGRTGISVNTFWDSFNPATFFIPYFFASLVVCGLFFFKASEKRLLIYIVILVLVASLLPIIILANPQTHMMGENIAWTREFNTYGSFISEQGQIERASGPLHKQIEFSGYHTIMVTFSRLSGFDSSVFNVWLTPLFFSFFIPLGVYFLIKTVFPNASKVASFAALSVLFSQHNVFLLFPPGKPETLALVFLILSILFWTKYLVEKNISVFLPLLFSFATLFIHPMVGIFSIGLTLIALYIRVIKPFDESYCSSKLVLLSKNIGYICLLIFISSTLILAYTISNYLGFTAFQFNVNFDLAQWSNVIFPPFVISQNNISWDGIRDLYLNNFTYVFYLFSIVGGVFLVRLKTNRKFLLLIIPLVVLAFSNMILQQFFFSNFWSREYYRFFYYMNLILSPIFGIGVYNSVKLFFSLSKKLKLKIIIKKREKKQFSISSVFFLKIIAILLSSLILVSSIYGGYPRIGSFGPYTGQSGVNISEFDTSAMKFISDKENETDHKFFIVGDSNTCGAALLTFGHKVYWLNGSYSSFVSYGSIEGGKVWSQLSNNPSIIVFNDALENLRADIIYVILTSRLGSELEATVEKYSQLMLEPVFYVPGQIFVYEYTADTFEGYFPIYIAGREENEFWRIDKLGTGSIDVTLSSDSNLKVADGNSHLINITQGKYSRFNLIHNYDVNQNWSNYDFMTFYWLGNASQILVNIVVGSSYSDFFVSSISDSFTGWQKIIIPLTNFQKIGSAQWGNLSFISIQFLDSPIPIMAPITVRIDEMAVLMLKNTSIVHYQMDKEVVNRILLEEQNLSGTYLILGDHVLASAINSILGNTAKWEYYPIEWKFFLDPLNTIRSRGFDRIYLVIANRTNYIALSEIAQSFLGEPMLCVNASIYVYTYSGTQIITEIFDGQLNFWNATAWGNGTIGTPVLSSMISTQKGVTRYLQVSVSSGNAANWGLYHIYDQPADWSTAKYISFWWCGNSSGGKFTIYAHLPTANDVAIATIKDDWSGWAHVVIPLSSFNTYGNSTWATVKYLRIGISSSTQGTWQLGNIYLEGQP